MMVAFILAASTIPSAVLAVSTGDTVSKGLRNLGNTCYLNAQLQSAFHIPRVREAIGTRRESEPSSDEEEDIGSKILGDNSVGSCKRESAGLVALRQVFRDMELASTNGYGVAVAPTVLCQTLGIPVMEQQDSQEFWKLLLPALDLEPLTDLYQGVYVDYISAVDGSGRERRRDEPFLDLSMDVNRDSLLDSFHEMFGTPELLSVGEGNGWRPQKGAEKVDALKGSQLHVEGLPSILQCHLKRFQYDWQSDVMSKINRRFKFPKELDLSTICVDASKDAGYAAVYDLQAVVVHVGDYGSGHYYAYVRPDIRSDDWYRFNDSDVSRVAFRDVIIDAYGGRTAIEKDKVKASQPTSRPGLLTRIFGARQGASFGWGGQTSSAYMIQYVRRKDTSMLYGEEAKD